MKASSLPFQRTILTSIIAGSLLYTGALKADDDCQGQNISGSETLDEQITLTAGTSAPSGATGTAELETDDEDGTSVSTLTFELSGLATDTYDVTITKKSDGSTEDLGTFDYPSTTTDDGGGCDDGSGDDSANGGSSTSSHVNPNVIMRCDGGSSGSSSSSGSSADDSSSSTDSTTSEIVFGGEDGIALPSDFNALDVATVTITDSSSNVIFTGDFTSASSSSTTSAIKAKINAHVKLSAGSGAPNATGKAVLTAHSRKGKVTSSFTLSAKNVPSSSTFSVSVNGSDVRSVKSTKGGKLVINGIKNENAFTLRSVKVHDSQGTTIVQASF